MNARHMIALDYQIADADAPIPSPTTGAKKATLNPRGGALQQPPGGR